ncbi:DUF6263 family protein [Flammeovirga aprica]|uniref:DUF4412 domain-containing protein n=1 Tax=Flammeovirga aprica JL-4 TaxID=694437 RepID=A0A7X9RYF7_9BACT|nr:DUF6263 family protein [Flammeovirga aprica]NME70929.1 hypothetical protein [Flammeovirga aprica JL-4]
MKNLLLLLLFLPFSLMAQTNLKLQKGEKYYQNTSNTIALQQTINGQEMNINIDNESKTSFLLEDVKGDNYTFRVTFEKLILGLEMGPQIQTFTSIDGVDPLSKFLNLLTQHHFVIVMSDKGKLLEVRDMDKLWAEIEKEPLEIPAMQKMQMINQLKQSYGQEQLKSNLELMFGIYPAKEVEGKQKWVINSTLKGGITADLSRTFMITETNDETVVLKEESILSTDPEKKDFNEVNGVPTRFEGEGTMNSTFTLDKTTGWVNNALIKLNVKGKSIVQMQGQEMTIPMVMKSITEVKNNEKIK